MKKYDLIIIGSGLFGSVIANELKHKYKILAIDKRNHIGGNCYTYPFTPSNIQIHKYGPHIFHTNMQDIWDYINQFAQFNNFTLRPKANYKGDIYSLPINLNTFYKLWGTISPEEAKQKLEEVKIKIDNPQNFEEAALSKVGEEIYQKLFYGYTKKQWGRAPSLIPAFIFDRIPIRFTYDDNYFDHRYQGIPIGGYTQIFEKLLDGVEIQLGCDFFSDRSTFERLSSKILYTGKIDELFNYSHGELEYRSMEFNHVISDKKDYQGIAMMNYTDEIISHTRIVEHKHFEFSNCEDSVITIETPGIGEDCYPFNNEKNNSLYQKYKELIPSNYYIGGRLGNYQYWDMDKTIKAALELSQAIR